MSDLDVERQRLLNVATAHAHIDSAVSHIEAALTLIRGEMATGLPIGHTSNTTETALKAVRVARENAWHVLKRMP